MPSRGPSVVCERRARVHIYWQWMMEKLAGLGCVMEWLAGWLAGWEYAQGVVGVVLWVYMNKYVHG